MSNRPKSPRMKVVYHDWFCESGYASDPAAEEGRIQSVLNALEETGVEYVEPRPATRRDLERVHTRSHVEGVRSRGRDLFEIASLAAGGAIRTAELAWAGEPAFALVRPPGHHASPASSWGFCYFNNAAIALERLRSDGEIMDAYLLDFDLHTGDGNLNCLGESPVRVLNPTSKHRESYKREVEEGFESSPNFDILCVSAGFDGHVDDWGGKLTTPDYREIGKWCSDFSNENCAGRRFAVLEGGYNHAVLGENVVSFLEGFGEQ